MSGTQTSTPDGARARSTSPATHELALLRERVALTVRASQALREHAWRALAWSDDLCASVRARRVRVRRRPDSSRDAAAQLLHVLEHVARADMPLAEDALLARLARSLPANDLRTVARSLRALHRGLAGRAPRFHPELRGG